MKQLFPTITCLMTIHMKPYAKEAIQSVLAQTRTDYNLVVVDSGAWIDKYDSESLAMSGTYFQYRDHPKIDWFFTGENREYAKEHCMVGVVFNQAYKQGLLKGKYICTFYDDDIYYPTFFEKMAGYLDAKPECGAVRCSENRTQIMPDGTKVSTPSLNADADIIGPHCDCRVDGMQVMYRGELLAKLEQPLMVEDDAWECSHSDGIFLDKLMGAVSKLEFIKEPLCEHRATPVSTYTPTVPKL